MSLKIAFEINAEAKPISLPVDIAPIETPALGHRHREHLWALSVLEEIVLPLRLSIGDAGHLPRTRYS